MSHHGLPWDTPATGVPRPDRRAGGHDPLAPGVVRVGRHATQEIPPVPKALLRPRWWWLPIAVVIATTTVITGAVVAFAWLWLDDPRPVGMASFGLAAGVHVVVAAEYLVLANLVRGRR